ncbi:MAG: aldose 1-epimerase family protein [Clostridia bacterium]|nr:aldose 1-epimerase family protein [Clostridia bacterium]
MIKKLENDFLSVEINEFGAELFSIKGKKSGFEYLWQGNPEFWKGRATILFPICGRLFAGKYIYKNKEYEMPIHGIAKLFEFNSRVISNKEIEFELKSSEKTKKYYPFDFIFKVKYKLKNNLLITKFIVKNTGEDVMFFSYGGHPGFNVPFSKNEKFENYYLEFSTNEMSKLIFSETCFDTGENEKISFTKKKLLLNHNLFDNDALFFKSESDKVKLKSTKSKNSIELCYKNMTCLGVWHKPKTDAPYICIEPWHGIPSKDGVIDDIETKSQMIKLDPNKKYTNLFTMKIIED